MKWILRTFFPATYFAIQREMMQDLFKFEFEMQDVETKYPNTSHGLQEFKYGSKRYRIKMVFVEIHE